MTNTAKENAKLVRDCFRRYLESEKKPGHVNNGDQAGTNVPPFPKYRIENVGYEMLPDGNVKAVRSYETEEEARREYMARSKIDYAAMRTYHEKRKRQKRGKRTTE